MKRADNLSLAVSLALSLTLASPACPALTPAQNAFVDDMVSRHAYPRETLVQALESARQDPRIIDAISRPAEALPWHRYRRIFLTDRRIEEGVAYWRQHADTLDRAAKTCGVPPEVIVAIIGVESSYGDNTGQHPVVDALNTLAFDYPKRADFFRGELENFFLLAREEGMDPLEPRGSYAGAMGRPQFIPSSFRRYAVDFDADGRRDLWHSDADVIGSIANFLAAHGWRTDEPVAYSATGDVAALEALSDGGSKPVHSITDLINRKITAPGNLPGTQLAVVIKLEQEDSQEYWLGFHNFYVITRYNHSNLYAMAVHQLGESIRERWAIHKGDLRR